MPNVLRGPRATLYSPVALPNAKVPGYVDAQLAGIEAQHHCTQANQAPAASVFRANVHAVSFCSDRRMLEEGDRVTPGLTKSQAIAPSPAMAAAT